MSTYLELGGEWRESAIKQVVDSMEKMLQDGSVVDSDVFKNLVSQHEILRSEPIDALHIAVAGRAYARIVGRAEEVAEQFTTRSEVEKHLLARLASGVALRQTVHKLIEEQ